MQSLTCSRFFENGSRNRFIELNFKHFLGRAPESVAEIAAHSAILDSAGYEADIDSYLDSDEYVMERQATEQADMIEQLRGELMSARSQSSIAEYKLNKWRRRIY